MIFPPGELCEVSGVTPSGDNLYTGTTRWADKREVAAMRCSHCCSKDCHRRIRLPSESRVMKWRNNDLSISVAAEANVTSINSLLFSAGTEARY